MENSRLSGLLEQKGHEAPASRLGGLLVVENTDPAPTPDTPEQASQRASQTLEFAQKFNLPIDTAEQTFEEYRNFTPADPTDIPAPAVMSQKEMGTENQFGSLQAAPEPGFWTRLLTQGYSGGSLPEGYFQMNPIKRAAFDSYMASRHYLTRLGGMIARETGLAKKDEVLALYNDELRANPKWYENAPEVTGWTVEKAAEYYALRGIFRSTGLSKLLTKAGERLARPFLAKELVTRGAETAAVLSKEGLKKVASDATVAFLKHAPENVVFLSAWSAGSAAMKDEDISDAAISGALWGLGFAALTPALGALGKVALATEAGQRLQFAVNRAYTSLWQNYPKLMNMGRKPFSDEFMAEAERQFRSRFGVEPTPADREALKKVTRMWGEAVTQKARYDAAAEAYWNSGRQAAKQTAQQAAETAGTDIVKAAAEGEIHPGKMTYADFFNKYGQELAKPEGSSQWLDKWTLPGEPESPSAMHKRLKNEAAIVEPENLLDQPKPMKEPLSENQFKAVTDNVVKAVKAVPQLIMNILEPSKAVERKFGGQVYADVIKGTFGHAESKGLDFSQHQLDSFEGDAQKLTEYFGQFSREDLKNLMMSRGNPIFEEAQILKDQAYDKLPDALKTKAVRKAIQEIADFNYDYLTQVVGDDIEKVRNYFYGNYKNPEKVDAFLDKWYRTTQRMTKEKKLPTVADAVAHGLELKSYNPVENLRQEFVAIARLEGMQWLRDELMKNGQGRFIDNMMDAPEDWVRIGNEPVFKDLRVQPDLARMINNLISTNKVSQNMVLRGIRHVNNFLRTLKFAGSTFHLMVELAASIADNPLMNPFRKSTLAGLHTGFVKNDPSFATPEYKEYVKLGGAHNSSIESEAMVEFKRVLEITLGKEFFGKAGKLIKGISDLPIPPLPGFANWLFESYIPRLQFVKYMDEIHRQEMKLGRQLTEPEKINIIKTSQTLYGQVNEKLFGRSGTVTSILRFIFLAPGFAEGNYRTILKSLLQWGINDGYNAQRDRANIINSLVLKGIVATIGTLILTGRMPEKPEKAEDIRDLWKIDTGQLDDKGRKVMIDTLTADKDYAVFIMNAITLRPDKFVSETFRRLGGMKAPLAEMTGDFFQMATGKALYDFKGDRVIEITDTFSQKMMKLIIHELEKIEPISVSTFKQAKQKDVDTALALVQSIVGVRPTMSEEDIRKQQSIHRIYSLKGQQEELYQYLRTLKRPREAIQNYNETVTRVLNSDFVPKEMRDEWMQQLLMDTDRLIKNKHEDYSSPAHTMLEAQRIREFLVNFDEKPSGVWEGPEHIKQALSDFTEKRRALQDKKEAGQIAPRDQARLAMYDRIQSKLSVIAKQIDVAKNQESKKSFYDLIEAVISSIPKD